MGYDIIIGRDEADKKTFKDRGLVNIGKGYVKMGQYTSMSNRILMDVARSHVVLVAGKRGCLTGESMIFTNKGHKPIKDFDEKKDKVLSFDKETKNFEWESAELLKYPIKNEKLLQIELVDGRILNLTKEHPLLASSGKKLLSLFWMNAHNLKKGDNLLSVNESFDDINPISIKSTKEISGINEVYDLSVDKNHSFIANGIISHNSGKSYSLGVIAEELSNLPKEASENIASLIFDTMGIYWTMKYENEKDKALLREWELKPKKLPVKIFVPHGHFQEYLDNGVPVDESFALNVSELNAEDWILTFGLDIIEPVSVLIQKIFNKLKLSGKNFGIDEIINEIQKDTSSDKETKNAAIALFDAAKTWGVFAEKSQNATSVKELVNAGTTTILDLSVYNAVGAFNIRALVISLVSRKIFNQRMTARKEEETEAIGKGLDFLSGAEKREYPLTWIFLDEGHEFLPLEGKTLATDALIQLLREGRQPGISLVLATQQPGQIHRDVMTQSDIVISHRVTSRPDLEALNYIMQSYVLESIKKQMDDLPSLKGSAIVLDDNSERIYAMRMRPRFTWHGGEAPTSVAKEKKF